MTIQKQKQLGDVVVPGFDIPFADDFTTSGRTSGKYFREDNFLGNFSGKIAKIDSNLYSNLQNILEDVTELPDCFVGVNSEGLYMYLIYIYGQHFTVTIPEFYLFRYTEGCWADILPQE